MKHLVLAALLLGSTQAFGQFNCQETKWQQPRLPLQTAPINYNSRSDTADLVHLKLSIDATQIASKNISGVAVYQMGIKKNMTQLRFDIIGYTVDSVVESGTHLPFSQTPNHLIVQRTANAGAALEWSIYYRGTTTKDGSGWGGIHHDGDYQYNLGVGFMANPHVYGRSLFPCFDNFVEKFILKEMNLLVGPGKVGASNGILDGVDTTDSGNLLWRWKGTAALPSYLVSMAISDYHLQQWTHDNKPFWLYGRAQDTANMSAGFVHLNDIYDAFVREFGPYRFEKVGYAMTITGAMEHAGMIHLPRTLANANLNGEDIIAHELAHMWFGNAITTETAEDMWINEGFAEFGSHLYEEHVYDRERYVGTVQDNQALVLRQAASADGGHLALSGVNQNQTYGTHTYQKGAMVAHNLREYLGDSLFSHGAKQVISQNTFGNYNAVSFQTAWEQATATALEDFWQDWIFHPGYYGVLPTLSYPLYPNWASPQKQVDLAYIHAHTPSTYSPSQKSVPVVLYKHSLNNGYQGKVVLDTSVDLSANWANGEGFTRTLELGYGQGYWLSANDSAESLGTSVYDTFRWSDLNGATTLPHTRVKVVPKATDLGLNGTFYIWHHLTAGMHTGTSWTSPDHVYFIGYEGSHDPPVDWIHEMPFEVTFTYNTLSTAGGLDAALAAYPTDSMGVSFSLKALDTQKSGPAASNLLPGVTHLPYGSTGRGQLTFTPQRLFGYYRIANSVPLSAEEAALPQQVPHLNLYPNPNGGTLRIELDRPIERLPYELYNEQGKLLQSDVLTLNSGKGELALPSHWTAGTYLLKAAHGQWSFQLVR